MRLGDKKNRNQKIERKELQQANHWLAKNLNKAAKMSNLTDCSKLDIPAIVGPAQVGQSLEQSQYDFFLQICPDYHAICNCKLRPNRLKCRSEAISDKKAPSEPVKVPLGPNKAPLSKPRLPLNLGCYWKSWLAVWGLVGSDLGFPKSCTLDRALFEVKFK